MSDLDIERQEREGDDGGWGGPNDGAAMMEMERLERHENRLILLTKALTRIINDVEASDDPDFHLAADCAARDFHLSQFERDVVKRAYDLDCHHAGQAEHKQLVEQAFDEIEQERDDDF